MRKLTFLTLVLLSCARVASADFYGDCEADCGGVQSRCLAAIWIEEPTAVQEAKQGCAEEFKICKAKCHEEDAQQTEVFVQEKAKREAEEAERKKAQERQDTLNGQIKILKFD